MLVNNTPFQVHSVGKELSWNPFEVIIYVFWQLLWNKPYTHTCVHFLRLSLVVTGSRSYCFTINCRSFTVCCSYYIIHCLGLSISSSIPSWTSSKLDVRHVQCFVTISDSFIPAIIFKWIKKELRRQTLTLHNCLIVNIIYSLKTSAV